MAFFRRKTTDRPRTPAGGSRRGAVSVSVSGNGSSYAAAREAKLSTTVPSTTPVKPAVEHYVGTTIEPAATAALRISSAADVDPNVKKFGEDGIFKGGAGGYGGAGTK